MSLIRLNRAAIIAIAAGTLATGFAYGGEPTAIDRLEKARIAFENAKAELQAAQEAVAEESGGEVEGVDDEKGERRVQPKAETEDEVPEPRSSWLDRWDWAVVTGITGSTGNTENFGARAALDGVRKTSKNETSLAFSYIYGTSDGQKNTSRGELRVRNDWLTESKWRYFVQGKYEYDEFQQWEHRLSGAGGVGYQFIEDDKTALLGRAGFGGSYELGGTAEEKFIPEGLVGLDWTYKYSQNTTLTASTTYYPSFDDLGEFRWNNRAELNVVIDKDTGMTLTTGFEHRHDSNPGFGFKPNDINYYMGLGWKF